MLDRRARFLGCFAFLLLAAATCRGGPPSNRLQPLDDAVARDPRTGLEWTRDDHPDALAWDAADRYCRELVLGDRRGWRLPEIGELEPLYDQRIDAPCAERVCRLDPAIRLGGPYIWTATARGAGTRIYFDASYGTVFSPGIGPKLVRRVICVRGTAATR